MPTPIILDADPGLDDAIAILMAASHPAIDLLAVTCVAGNAPLERTERNARSVLTAAGVTDIPVAAGLDRPLLRELVTAPEVHGSSGLAGVAVPAPAFDLDPRHAVDLIREVAMASPEPIVLIATGPLANVAMALRREPQLQNRIRRIVLMGGSIGQGNTTPSAEFNIFVDPHAARIVFQSGIPITMVGLDVTHRALVGADEVVRIRDLATVVGRLAAALIDQMRQAYAGRRGWTAAPLHDACCVAEVIEPGLIETRPMDVQIETDSSLTMGRTVCDVDGLTGRTPNADVGVHIDAPRFVEILLDCLARYN